MFRWVFISSLMLAGIGTATGATVSLTFNGIATGSYDCFFSVEPDCQVLTKQPFSLTLYGPSESFTDFGSGYNPPPITGGNLIFGSINEPLFEPDPAHQLTEGFYALPDATGGGLYLYQGNPLYPILTFLSDGFIGYNYDHALYLPTLTIIPHQEPSGIEGAFLGLESGYIRFDSLTDASMSAAILAAPEPADFGLAPLGLVVMLSARYKRR